MRFLSKLELIILTGMILPGCRLTHPPEKPVHETDEVFTLSAPSAYGHDNPSEKYLGPDFPSPHGSVTPYTGPLILNEPLVSGSPEDYIFEGRLVNPKKKDEPPHTPYTFGKFYRLEDGLTYALEVSNSSIIDTYYLDQHLKLIRITRHIKLRKDREPYLVLDWEIPDDLNELGDNLMPYKALQFCAGYFLERIHDIKHVLKPN